MYFDFFDRISLQVEGSAAIFFDGVFAYNECDPSKGSRSRQIIVRENHQLAPDGVFLSQTAAFSDEFLYLADGQGRWLALSLNEDETCFRLCYQPGFSVPKLSRVVEWGLHILASHEGLAFIHSMGYGMPNGAVVCPAWLNTGKTKTFIRLLAAGNSYVGDDWSVVDGKSKVWAYAKAPFLYLGDLREIRPIVRPHLGRREQFVIGIDALLESSRVGRRLEHLIMRVLGVSFPIMPGVSKLTKSVLKPETPLYRLLYLTRCDDIDFSLAPLPREEWLSRIMQIYRYEHGLFVSPYVFMYAFPRSKALASHYRRVESIVGGLDWPRGRLLRIPQRATSLNIEGFLRRTELCE